MFSEHFLLLCNRRRCLRGHVRENPEKCQTAVGRNAHKCVQVFSMRCVVSPLVFVVWMSRNVIWTICLQAWHTLAVQVVTAARFTLKLWAGAIRPSRFATWSQGIWRAFSCTKYVLDATVFLFFRVCFFLFEWSWTQLRITASMVYL